MSGRFMKNFSGEKIFSLEYDKETLRDMVIAKQEEKEELQQRIDKAIEQCKQDIKDIWKWEGAYTEMFDEIIEILKGSE